MYKVFRKFTLLWVLQNLIFLLQQKKKEGIKDKDAQVSYDWGS